MYLVRYSIAFNVPSVFSYFSSNNKIVRISFLKSCFKSGYNETGFCFNYDIEGVLVIPNGLAITNTPPFMTNTAIMTVFHL